MKKHTTYSFIIILSICLAFYATNLFGEKSFVRAEEVPIGLDSASWQEIRNQIKNPESEIENFSVPATFAPLYNSEIKLVAADAQADDWFGYSVDIDGDVAVVGAYKEDSVHGDRTGSAYIFERNFDGTDSWKQVKQLHGHAAYDVFGACVAVDGDVIVVGAWGQDTGGNNSGAAYVFERSFGGPNNWGEVKTLKASDPAADDRFGLEIAVAGDVIVAGVYRKNGLTGAAYIYERNAGGVDNWGQVKKITASDAQPDDRFGYQTDVEGDVVIVGSYYKNGSNDHSGAAYVFERNTNGKTNNWGQVKKLVSPVDNENDYFGIDVAVNGGVAVVGAYGEDAGGITKSGAAYIFERNIGGTNNWGRMKKLTADNTEESAYFGYRVAMNDGVVVVAATYEDAGGIENSGAAYVFKRNAGVANVWSQTKKIVAPDPLADDNFGRTFSVSGDVAVFGLYKRISYRGIAYIISVSDETKMFSETKKKVASDAQTNNYLGCSTAINGDVIIAGAYGEDENGTDSGAAYIFERNANGGTNNWGEIKKIMAAEGQEDDYFGCAVAVAGDVVAVGAYGEDTDGIDSGAAYIFERNIDGSNGWKEIKKLTPTVAQPSNYFGCSVAAAGDVVIVGAKAGDSNAAVGAAYIFERNIGGTNTWGEVKKLVPSDGNPEDLFGVSVAVAGDVAVVGAMMDNGSGEISGAAYVFERNIGGVNNWGEVIKLTATDAGTNGRFGASVAVAGDVVIVGASTEDANGILNSGAAYVFERNANGGTNNWAQVKKILPHDAQANDYFGNSVAVAGDVAVIGADTENKSGAAYVFQRNANGTNAWGEINKLLASDMQISNCFKNVAVSDGVIAIGAHGNNSNAGAVYVFEEFVVLPPEINNDSGATDVSETSATLNGEVSGNGGANADVTIFWGDNDGGTATGNWAYAIDNGIQSGNFSSAVTGLEQNKMYYYRCYATNSVGEAWADFTTNFTTLGFPFIKITNENTTVDYNVSTYTIAGTNNENVVGIMDWTNSLTGENGAVPVSNFQFQFSINLDHGDNIVKVSGTNVAGHSTNSVVCIHRKTWIESAPQIAANALIFPASNSIILAPHPTNIIWDVSKITDETDLTITKISVHLASNSNEVAVVTNDISNLLGEITWDVPESLIGNETNYVMKFEVVNTLSLTNSRVFLDNVFVIVPEPFCLLFVIYQLLFIKLRFK